MKKNLFIVILVMCFVGLAFGSTPMLKNDFRVKDNTSNVFNLNTLFETSNNKLLDTTLVTGKSRRSLCSDPSYPEGEAIMTPHCVEILISGGGTPPDMLGQTQKGAIPFSSAHNLVARYYKRYPDSKNFEYVEEKPLISYTVGGGHFQYELPTYNQTDIDLVFFQIRIVDTTPGGDGEITRGHLEVVYTTS